MDAERLSRYYGQLAKRYVRRSRAVLIVPALFATSAVVALLHTLPELVLTAANVVIVGISMVAIVTQPSIKTTTAKSSCASDPRISRRGRKSWLASKFARAFGTELMDAERLSRYYGQLAKRYVRRSRAVLIVPALFATSAVVALLHTLPELVLTAANVVIVGISMVAIVTQPSIKAAGIIVVSNACDDLLVDWKRLWADTEHIDDEAARKRLHELNLKTNAATNKAKETRRAG